MALSNIEKERFQTGDRVEPYFVTDDEIESYLEEYADNVRRTSTQVAHAILFQLGANPSIYRERTGEEEVFTSDPFKSYKEALLLYIKYPHHFLTGITPYAAGISKADVATYKGNLDTNIVGYELPANSNTNRYFEENATAGVIIPIFRE